MKPNRKPPHHAVISPEQAERLRSFEFMQTPSNWPLWPALPLKSRTELHPELDRALRMPKIGFLLDLENGPFGGPECRPTTVYLGDVYQYLDKTIRGNPLDLPKQQYDSFQAIVDAGWVVD